MLFKTFKEDFYIVGAYSKEDNHIYLDDDESSIEVVFDTYNNHNSIEKSLNSDGFVNFFTREEFFQFLENDERKYNDATVLYVSVFPPCGEVEIHIVCSSGKGVTMSDLEEYLYDNLEYDDVYLRVKNVNPCGIGSAPLEAFLRK